MDHTGVRQMKRSKAQKRVRGTWLISSLIGYFLLGLTLLYLLERPEQSFIYVSF